MNKQFVLLSCPRSGTDWFMDALTISNNNISYFREFFNPLTSEFKYRELISTRFGSEFHPDNIVFPHSIESLEKIYNSTWEVEPYNTTKEVFSGWKVDFYIKYFDMAFLIRSPLYTFPGGTLYTIAYNRPIYFAVANNIKHMEDDLLKLFFNLNANLINDCDILLQQSAIGYIIQNAKLLKEAKKHNIKVIRYESLISMTVYQMIPYLEERMPNRFNIEELSVRLVHTKRIRQPEYVECISRLNNIYEEYINENSLLG